MIFFSYRWIMSIMIVAWFACTNKLISFTCLWNLMMQMVYIILEIVILFASHIWSSFVMYFICVIYNSLGMSSLLLVYLHFISYHTWVLCALLVIRHFISLIDGFIRIWHLHFCQIVFLMILLTFRNFLELELVD